jgi:Uma2 family endonuclease
MSFTYDDLSRVPEQFHCEILDGRLIVNGAGTLLHQAVLGNIASLLDRYVSMRRTGMVLVGPVDVVLAPNWVLNPDIVYIQMERRAIMTELNVSGAPDLVVEVLSDTTRRRDEIIKRRVYEQFGVYEYWRVDPDGRSIRINRRNDHDVYDSVIEIRDDGMITSPLFPDLEIPLAEVFADSLDFEEPSVS